MGQVFDVAVIGAGGYSGAELLEILLGHPGARVVGVFGSSRREGQAPRLEEVFPRFRDRLAMRLEATDVPAVRASGARAVFLATPHEASIELAPKLLEAGLVVLDLSGAFRLRDASLYPAHYGFEHHAPSWLERAVYGLPEVNRSRIARADLVAVPGCYPTSAILALHPLVQGGAIGRDRHGRAARPVIDATSGVSGAGRTPAQRTLYCEVSQQAYNVFKHRHNPEIDLHAGVGTVFTAHLGPYDRGILSTIHAELADGWDLARVSRAYAGAYEREPFVRLAPAGVWPAVGDVVRTNFCDLGWAVDEAHQHVVVCSAIDNLVKGAAGQAVQCFNIRMGLPEGMGLSPRAGISNGPKR